jgi:hypothetical protein
MRKYKTKSKLGMNTFEEWMRINSKDTFKLQTGMTQRNRKAQEKMGRQIQLKTGQAGGPTS